MHPPSRLILGAALALLSLPNLHAQQPDPEMDGLQQASVDFVTAYNRRDAEAIAALFLENGEMTDLTGSEVITGRSEIAARYRSIFAAKSQADTAVEVASVRIVAPNIAIEDGVFHLDPPGEGPPARSIAYTAVLAKDTKGTWRIASTRDVKDVTDPAGQLSQLAEKLKGDWTSQRDGVRLDFAFGWDDSGKFLTGEMLATAEGAPPQSTTLRIAWDGARKTITWWSFDDAGGFAKGDWSQDGDSWIIRNEGTSANAEATSANARLTFEGTDTMIWSSRDRLVDGERLPDLEMRIVRQAPEPEDPSAPSAE